MKWTPDTHDITFDLSGNKPAVIKCANKYKNIEASELYTQILNENQRINSLNRSEEEIKEIKEGLLSGDILIEDVI